MCILPSHPPSRVQPAHSDHRLAQPDCAKCTRLEARIRAWAEEQPESVALVHPVVSETERVAGEAELGASAAGRVAGRAELGVSAAEWGRRRRKLTWRELDALVDAAAHRVRSRMRERPAGECVPIRPTSGADILIRLLGAHRAGRAVALSNARWSERQHREWLETMALTGKPGHQVPDDLALLVPTSGTSGRPRAVMLTHEGLTANAAQFIRSATISRDTRALVPAPLFHVAGLNVLTWPTLSAGGTVELIDAFEPEEVLRRLPEATHTVMVPTMWQRLLREGLNASHTGTLRVAISGGAPLTSGLQSALLERGVPLAHGYGLTEASAMVSLRIDDPAAPDTPAPADAGLVGHLTEVRIEAMEARYPEVGRILVRGPQVMAGYFPEMNGVSAEGWLDTGDLGFVDAQGHVHVLGRADDMMISGGENVFPAPVEAALETLPGIARAAVVGVPDEEWGERVVAFVEPAGTLPSLAEVRDALRQVLPAHALPRELRTHAPLPLLGSGKLDRQALRHQVSARRAS